MLYILEGREPVLMSDVRAWGAWFETAERHVDETLFASGARVSTVFSGIDDGALSGQSPLLFETMVFNPDGLGVYQERYATWAQAEAGHAQIVDAYARGELLAEEV